MEAKKAAFMGKITAGVTHEMKNVLAIIKESAGLLDDLISLAKDDSPPPRDKLLRTATRITDQVARGVDLATKLNSFAHCPDQAVASVDLNQVMEQTGFLCQRFARLKGITLHIVTTKQSHVVMADPLALQMLLFQCVELLMDSEGKGSVITVQSNSDGNKIVMAVSEKTGTAAQACPDGPFEASKWTAIHTDAQGLKLSVETGCAPLWISVNF